MNQPERHNQVGDAGSDVAVAPVRGRGMKQFIRLPWKIYADDPVWVPPLLSDQRKLFDRSKHPFHEHADVEYFLAWRGSEPVGRIAAFINHRYNEFHEDHTGFFGFFECVDDRGVAHALLDTAETWVREHGAHKIMGPMNFSTNDESHSPGILLDGFDKPPIVLMAHGRPYYQDLVESAGYGKVEDLLAYWIDSNETPDRLARVVQRIERSIDGFSIRPVDLKKLDREVELIQQIYNSAWEENWGFVPLTEKEIEHLAKELKPIVEPRYALLAFMNGDPAGFALTLPDFNQALKHVNGRLLPFGIPKLLWYTRKIDKARVFALGLKPEYRGLGIDVIFYTRAFMASRELGHTGGECSWILEDNWKMRRGLEKAGAYVYKTYRVYQKETGGA
jgi:GNAT superfamily N-acetyltransferase